MLNEGRDFKPGDTRLERARQPGVDHCSTKAGILSPATRVGNDAQDGAVACSTKAGILSPATHRAAKRDRDERQLLNEGRDFKPGDTSDIGEWLWHAALLNEGRDFKPGDTSEWNPPLVGMTVAQRRPGF